MPPSVPAGRSVADLENTLTHELGHVLGLDHTCSVPGVTPASEVDDTGAFPPACDALASLPAAEQTKIETATMYPTYSTGEISKRTPHPDDLAGVEVDYPTAGDPKSCEHASVGAFQKSSCALAPNGQTPAAIVLVMFALLGLLRRRARAHNSRQ
jgi:MYXO-CTERM domain-containing protein